MRARCSAAAATGSSCQAQAGRAPPKPGEVVTLEPIQINLAAGHYLRIGIALQLTAKAHEADGSKALDADHRRLQRQGDGRGPGPEAARGAQEGAASRARGRSTTAT